MYMRQRRATFRLVVSLYQATHEQYDAMNITIMCDVCVCVCVRVPLVAGISKAPGCGYRSGILVPAC